MTVADITKNAEQKMQSSIESFKGNLAKIRTGRAHTGLLDHVQVDYYGSMVPISQVANVTLVDGRTIGVQPWEKKMVGVVEKAIRDADLGLNPATQGDLIRVPMPMLTEERRRELTKLVKSEGENAKVAVRNLRRDANEQLKKLVKEKEASEDDERRGSDVVQKLTDKSVVEIDELVQQKDAEIMKV
ncbi:MULTISPECIES: ribosome recycling factor [Pandoraea]|uniref:Ribosome-recycling factor n=2 Tax=Pandoraea TaxID=93217 RepID=A0A5E4ZBG1_9BURK|nr:MULTISPECIES: ribosome recycling factor [Pandoraea]ALS62113.1 ribosome recycling factor [Pandoraea norimbergensis]VVE32867.1 ribosome-recycling factor [Pandoraea iniqua]VVE57630.1 ribosome-recycling factor [Pandoraea iniqua]